MHAYLLGLNSDQPSSFGKYQLQAHFVNGHLFSNRLP